MDVRDRPQRKRDVLSMLETEVDLWVASVSESGEPYLVPLSFAWNGAEIIMACPERSLTARNLSRSGKTRLGIGPTRDVVMIDGTVELIDVDADDELASLHASRAGFDARQSSDPYIFLLVRPIRIQAWRNPAELAQRLLMTNGAWLV